MHYRLLLRPPLLWVTIAECILFIAAVVLAWHIWQGRLPPVASPVQAAVAPPVPDTPLAPAGTRSGRRRAHPAHGHPPRRRPPRASDEGAPARRGCVRGPGMAHDQGAGGRRPDLCRAGRAASHREIGAEPPVRRRSSFR